MTSALIVVDVQADFLPGGALGVPEGDKIVDPILNYASEYDYLAISMDLHPSNHNSFQYLGGPWPPHCVAGTEGSHLDQRIRNLWRNTCYTKNGLARSEIFKKGMNPQREAYSVFDAINSNLEQWLTDRGVDEVYVCGLATEYCVKATALDARRHRFKTFVLRDAIAGVNVKPTDCDDAISEMIAAGVAVI
jgi:nicotinamidase/pyrazinamidase